MTCWPATPRRFALHSRHLPLRKLRILRSVSIHAGLLLILGLRMGCEFLRIQPSPMPTTPPIRKNSQLFADPKPRRRAREHAGLRKIRRIRRGAPRNARRLKRPTWRQWTAPSFDVESNSPVPAGVDGEALVFDPPLRFTIRPAVLRARIAPQHPGASPSAAQPDGLVDAIKKLLRIVRTG